MVKKISNVFNYLNYRVLLNEDFLTRTMANHSYSLRAYSRDLSVSPGFLSDILKGKKDLSPNKGREVFRRLGFENTELDYIENLILLTSTDDENVRQEANSYIQRNYNRVGYKEAPGRQRIIESVEHFFVYCVVRKLSELTNIFIFTDEFGISREKVLDILNDFINDGYISESDGKYTVTDLMLVISTHKKMVEIAEQFVSKVMVLIKDNGGNRPPEASASGLVLGVDEESFKLVYETHIHCIKSLNRIASQSKGIDRFVYYGDAFYTAFLQPKPKT
jgi:uncharacterized protein (TIGR02147 family)